MTEPVILQVVPELTTGGAELSALEMAGAVQLSGGTAIVVAKSGEMIPKLEKTGARYIAIDVASKNPLRIIRNIWVLAKIIRQYNVSLVHARSRAPAWSAWLAAKKTNIPYLATYHGAYGETNSIKRWYNRVMVRGKLTIANSHYVRDLVCQRYGLSRDQVRTIYRGIDFEKYDSVLVSVQDKKELLQKWDIETNQKIMLLAARLSPIKGHLVVIGAAKVLKDKGLLKNHVFVFAGGDQGRESYVAELRQKIEDYGLGLNFRLVGHVGDMAVAYGVATVSMSTSIVPETFGRTGAEAQAMECPIIATRLGAPRETCLTEPEAKKEDITGWLVEAGDVDGLADMLETILEMGTDEQKQIGLRARAYVLGKFPVSQMQSQTLEVYDELLGSTLAKRFENHHSTRLSSG